MKRFLVIFAAFIMVMMAFTMAVGTASADKKGKTITLDYIQADWNWNPVINKPQPDGDPDGDGWGTLTYESVGTEFEYTFNGHGLSPGDRYGLFILRGTTIWHWVGLGWATVNNDGNLKVQGSKDTGDLKDATVTLVYPGGYPYVGKWIHAEDFNKVTYTKDLKGEFELKYWWWAPDDYEDAWGKMKYEVKDEFTLKFDFKGYDLVPGERYELRSQAVALGKGTADKHGKVHIKVSFDFEDVKGGHGGPWTVGKNFMNLWVLGDNDKSTWDDTRVLRSGYKWT